MRADAEEIIAQLEALGLLRYAQGPLERHEHGVRGTMGLMAVVRLRADKRFVEGGLHKLHAEVGDNLTEFRSHRGECCPGSLQIVIDKTTGRFWADNDYFSPYTDAVNWIGHAGEVVAGWWRKRKTGDAV